MKMEVMKDELRNLLEGVDIKVTVPRFRPAYDYIPLQAYLYMHNIDTYTLFRIFHDLDPFKDVEVRRALSLILTDGHRLGQTLGYIHQGVHSAL